MASIRDVAKEAGVSPATVSRTFTTPGLINAQTQQRVLAAARQLDYSPPRLRAPRLAPSPIRGLTSRDHASSLLRPTPSVDAIGFQFFSATTSPYDTLATNTFYTPVLFGAQAETARLGLHLLMHTTDRHSVAATGGMPRMIAEQAVGGLLLVGTADPEVIGAFAAHVPNIILVDNHDETGTYESVVSDGFAGAMAATRYLLSLGHRRIAFFLVEEGVVSFNDRLRGYRCALMEAGIVPDPALLFDSKCLSDDPAVSNTAARLRRDDGPTALLGANDEAALSMLRACHDFGLRVPEDLSIVGFDNTPAAESAVPALTTVHVNKEALGSLAVRRLYERMRPAAVGTTLAANTLPVRHVVPVKLIVRESCRSPEHG
jgi:DNA-binding LacI/PurR family transcriptional regulator